MSDSPPERAPGAETVWLRHLSEEELERGVREAIPAPRLAPPAGDDAAEQRAHERAKRARFEPED